MLTGRESLIRLIGKRRRFLPNRQSLLSAPIESTLSLSGDENGGMLERTAGVSGETTSSKVDWVPCPVCGSTIRGEDYMINSHLDACLARGTKRKLTQRTLLQLNFCSRSMDKLDSGESKHLENSGVLKAPDNNLVRSTTPKFSYLGAFEENDNKQFKLDIHLDSVMRNYIDSSAENLINDDTTSYDTSSNSPSLLPKDEMPKHDITVAMDNLSGVTLETFIVGRKFSDEEELNIGASISLLRDPDNVKDPNAIKVSSGCSKVLGFLPRELAQYLSPLIEKYCMNFEGCVTSVPKHSLDVVPIQIVNQIMIPCGEKEFDDLEAFRFLWKRVLQTVESAKTCPPSIAKYQRNFCFLIQEVLASNPHLFTDDEKIFLGSFTSLSDDCQRIFVRLYTRKGPWFRMCNISYPEVLDSKQAVRGLSDAGYICSSQSMIEPHDNGDMKEVLNLLTVSELREISSALQHCHHGTRKQDLIASLLSSYEDGLCPLLQRAILNKTGTCVRISCKAESLVWRALRLFFLNGEQDLSAFLLVDLGIVKYPTYNCIISDQIFPGLNDLLAYEEAIEVAQIMDEALDDKNSGLVLRCISISNSRLFISCSKSTQSSASESAATFLSCLSASWVYSKVVLLGISFLERERRYDDAVHLLKRLLDGFTCDGRRGYWTLRLSVDLEHLGRLNESLSVAEDGLLDPWVRAGSRMALQRRVLRLGKPPRRWKTPCYSEAIKRKIIEVHVQGRPLNCETGMKSRFYGEDGEQCGVEQLALQYYAGEGGGWQGVHTESGIWLTIFGLLMWDIIFADVPNVFHTRFQTAPLDLETQNFYVMRKSLIESHLEKINSDMAEEILITSWESHVGVACRGVNWDRHSLSELRAAVTCIGGPCLASICRHLAQDYRSWSSGMPDLLLWRFHEDYKGEAKLVEVKGPRDRLSEQQRAWLLLLMDYGFNVEVCKVGPASK
ncbi:unnamed protein product, partial [Vitis vinifera]